MALFGINAGDLGIETQIDACLVVEAVGTQRHPILWCLTGKVILRQIRSINRCSGITAQHDDAAAKLPPPQHLGRGEAGRATTNNDYLVRCISWSFGARLRLLTFLMNEDLAISLLDLPAVESAYGRCAYGFAAAQIETGVVPGASNAVTDYEPFTERSVVMAALGCNGEYLDPVLNKQDLLVAHMPQEFSICKLRKRNALGQVGAARWGLFLRHAFRLRHVATPHSVAQPASRKNTALRALGRHAEKFLTSQWIFSETAQHAAGD